MTKIKKIPNNNKRFIIEIITETKVDENRKDLIKL